MQRHEVLAIAFIAANKVSLALSRPTKAIQLSNSSNSSGSVMAVAMPIAMTVVM